MQRGVDRASRLPRRQEDVVVDRVYTAVVQRDDKWWIGWIEEIPGVNSQGRTRKELLENLASALQEALEMNRTEALAAATGDYEEVSLRV
jgi:predicted RNase H-like HicB family nuclease